jgi:hypothetical protein
MKRFQQPANEPMQPVPPGRGAEFRQRFPPSFSDKPSVEGKFTVDAHGEEGTSTVFSLSNM